MAAVVSSYCQSNSKFNGSWLPNAPWALPQQCNWVVAQWSRWQWQWIRIHIHLTMWKVLRSTESSSSRGSKGGMLYLQLLFIRTVLLSRTESDLWKATFWRLLTHWMVTVYTAYTILFACLVIYLYIALLIFYQSLSPLFNRWWSACARLLYYYWNIISADHCDHQKRTELATRLSAA